MSWLDPFKVAGLPQPTMALSVLPKAPFHWVAYSKSSQIYLTSHNTLPGGHSDLSTFIAEACEYLKALYALRTTLTTFPPQFLSRFFRSTHWKSLSSKTLPGYSLLHSSMTPVRFGLHMWSMQSQIHSPYHHQCSRCDSVHVEYQDCLSVG